MTDASVARDSGRYYPLRINGRVHVFSEELRAAFRSLRQQEVAE
jgi:hypothetical protein